MNKEGFIPNVINWAESHGFNSIRANIEGYEKPVSYERANDSELFTPDVTAVNMYNKHYLEVAMKSDANRGSISKWKLLSELAGMKGGKLYLMAPRGHVRFAREMVTQYNIQAEVVQMK
ncbi:hypothetical protein [Telluribacter sp.]|jgi:hypothetical protein|uniref:hypothetical protein n=1 Tax=Telluribacter sp. TaxID=1978767 RepID=UPI002E1179B2|nr:hypothetical protein [Telluribacter sp.]